MNDFLKRLEDAEPFTENDVEEFNAMSTGSMKILLEELVGALENRLNEIKVDPAFVPTDANLKELAQIEIDLASTKKALASVPPLNKNA